MDPLFKKQFTSGDEEEFQGNLTPPLPGGLTPILTEPTKKKSGLPKATKTEKAAKPEKVAVSGKHKDKEKATKPKAKAKAKSKPKGESFERVSEELILEDDLCSFAPSAWNEDDDDVSYPCNLLTNAFATPYNKGELQGIVGSLSLQDEERMHWGNDDEGEDEGEGEGEGEEEGGEEGEGDNEFGDDLDGDNDEEKDDEEKDPMDKPRSKELVAQKRVSGKETKADKSKKTKGGQKEKDKESSKSKDGSTLAVGVSADVGSASASLSSASPSIFEEGFLENTVFALQTGQISPFRTTMTSLKDILEESNLYIDATGIKIINFEKSHTILVHMWMDAEKFEFFQCKPKKIIVGVNMTHLFKMIDTLEPNDTMTIFIENDAYSDGIVTYLSFRFENDLHQVFTQHMRVIEPDPEEISYPDTVYSSVINLQSSEFHKIIRRASKVGAPLVEFNSVGNKMITEFGGEFSKARLEMTETPGVMKYVSGHPTSTQITQGVFPIKMLGYLIKCQNLSPVIDVYLENDLPLVVNYDHGLGFLHMCVAQYKPTE